MPLQAENPGGGGTSLRRSCRHRGLAAGKEEHGSADSCGWRRDTELRRRDLGRVPGPGPRSGLEWVTRLRGTFLPWRRRTCGLRLVCGGICAWLQVFPGAVPAQCFLVAPRLPLALGRWMWSSLRRSGQRGLGASVPPARPELAPSWCCPCPRFHRPAFLLLSTYYVPGCALRAWQRQQCHQGVLVSPQGAFVCPLLQS